MIIPNKIISTIHLNKKIVISLKNKGIAVLFLYQPKITSVTTRFTIVTPKITNVNQKIIIATKNSYCRIILLWMRMTIFKHNQT